MLASFFFFFYKNINTILGIKNFHLYSFFDVNKIIILNEPTVKILVSSDNSFLVGVRNLNQSEVKS